MRQDAEKPCLHDPFVTLTPGWSGPPREGCRRRCGAEGGCRVPRKKHHQRITAWRARLSGSLKSTVPAGCRRITAKRVSSRRARSSLALRFQLSLPCRERFDLCCRNDDFDAVRLALHHFFRDEDWGRSEAEERAHFGAHCALSCSSDDLRNLAELLAIGTVQRETHEPGVRLLGGSHLFLLRVSEKRCSER